MLPGEFQDSYMTAVDIERYSCASAPVVNRMRVASKIMCAMKCLQEPACLYFNVEVIQGSTDVMCAVTDINEAVLSSAASFTPTGTWYSLD